MSRTYKAIGINLKSVPIGEFDRLVTILTKEFGLIRVVAPGSRKHQSTLRGCSGLFVINQLLIVKGRSLDKIIQAESLESYAGLSQDLRKLTASQYLAELVLCQALSDQPQDELFSSLRDHLSRLEAWPGSVTLGCLVHAIFHFLALAGVAPRVHACCVTQQLITPDFTNPEWRVGFSASAGGAVWLPPTDTWAEEKLSHFQFQREADSVSASKTKNRVVERAIAYSSSAPLPKSADLLGQLDATQLALLQQLSRPDFIQSDGTLSPSQDYSLTQAPSERIWLSLERILRNYAQYHFECPIRSATLIDTCFLSQPSQFCES
jgi:DNA repair protein RecO (recombination protein O)